MMHIGEHGISNPGPYPNLPRKPARWLRDPTQRHEYRYWNATMWTDQVSDNDVVSTDPITDADVFVPSTTGVPGELPPIRPVVQGGTVGEPTRQYPIDLAHPTSPSVAVLKDQLAEEQRRYASLRARIEQSLENVLKTYELPTPVVSDIKNLLDLVQAHHGGFDDTIELPPV